MYIHKMEYYSAVQRNKPLIHTDNMGEFQKHLAEWNKSNTKVYTLCDFTYMKFWKGKTLVVAWDPESGQGINCKETGRNFLRWRKYFDCGGGYMAVYSSSKFINPSTSTLKMGEFCCISVKLLEKKNPNGRKHLFIYILNIFSIDLNGFLETISCLK